MNILILFGALYTRQFFIFLSPLSKSLGAALMELKLLCLEIVGIKGHFPSPPLIRNAKKEGKEE